MTHDELEKLYEQIDATIAQLQAAIKTLQDVRDKLASGAGRAERLMQWLGPVLLIGVFVRHDTAQWLPGYTPPEWFYILGGTWEILLCASILLTRQRHHNTSGNVDWYLGRKPSSNLRAVIATGERQQE